MANVYRLRRLVAVMAVLIGLVIGFVDLHQPSQAIDTTLPDQSIAKTQTSPALSGLADLAIKGRAPKTDYDRSQFGDNWATTGGCDTRNIILNRDLTNVEVDQACNVTKGSLNDPYTGKTIRFIRGTNTSASVQIDHVVALSDAWQTGAQQLSRQTRIALANDPLELLAVDGAANQQKLDGDAATWLPPNKAFRCQYIARQIAVKLKYQLWITQAEHDAMTAVLDNCLDQQLPIE